MLYIILETWFHIQRSAFSKYCGCGIREKWKMSFLTVTRALPPTPARARVQTQTHFTHPSWPLSLLPKFPDMLSHSRLTLAPRWKAPCFISSLLGHLFILHWKWMWAPWPLEFAINSITVNHECKYNCISQAWASFKRLGKKKLFLEFIKQWNFYGF